MFLKWSISQIEHFSNGAILKSNISQMEHFSNGAFLKWSNSQMEQFSNGAILKWSNSQMEQFSNRAIWGRHHQLDDSLVGQLTKGLVTTDRDTIGQDRCHCVIASCGLYHLLNRKLLLLNLIDFD